MNVVDATSILGAATAVIGTLLLPPYFAHRKAQNQRDENEDISWIGINKALVRERDRLALEVEKKDGELERQESSHAATLFKMQEQHQAENEEWARKVAECQAKVQALYGELYELQRLLPPNLRPGPDNGVG